MCLAYNVKACFIVFAGLVGYVAAAFSNVKYREMCVCMVLTDFNCYFSQLIAIAILVHECTWTFADT